MLYVTAEQIKAVAREQGIQIWEQPPLTIRKRLCQTGRATKREAAKIIADKYPELLRYYNRQRFWEQEYYSNLFDAVAVGLVCLDDLRVTQFAGYSLEESQ